MKYYVLASTLLFFMVTTAALALVFSDSPVNAVPMTITVVVPMIFGVWGAAVLLRRNT